MAHVRVRFGPEGGSCRKLDGRLDELGHKGLRRGQAGLLSVGCWKMQTLLNWGKEGSEGAGLSKRDPAVTLGSLFAIQALLCRVPDS